MKERFRSKLEGAIIDFARKFSDVGEVWYNPSHLDPDGELCAQECYVFITKQKVFDFELAEKLADLELRLFRRYEFEGIVFQLPFSSNFERKIYPRGA